MGKNYLDAEGLALYDKLIKEYIDNANSSDNAAIQRVKDELQALADGAVKDNTDAIAILNGDANTNGSVTKQVNDAIAALVNGAPEALDTLKELADWVSNDESGATKLVERVDNAETAIDKLQKSDEALKEYLDAQDEAYYNSIHSIENLKIKSLFPEKQAENQTAVDAIASIEAGSALKLTANQEIAEDLVIDKSCYIDANGSTFSGTVTVPANIDVIIENANFANPVVVA